MREKIFYVIIFYLIGAIIALIFLFPILWQFLTSLKPYPEIIKTRWPDSFIFDPIFENYFTAYNRLSHAIANSLVVAGTSTVISVLIGAFAAYSMARFDWRGKDDLAFLYLSIRIFPPVVSVIPLYIVAHNFGMIDTYPPLTLLNTYMNIAFVTWILRGIFEEIPPDYEESAMVDGCSKFGAMRRILFPLAAPGFIVAALFSFVFSWNEFLVALCLTGPNAQTAPVRMSGYLMRQQRIPWEEVTAASTIYVIPILIILIIVRKHIVRGLTFGLVRPKG